MKRALRLAAVLLVFATFGFAQFTFTSIDCPGANSTRVRGINSHGDMVGDYTLPGGNFHAMMIKKGKCIPLAPTTILGTNPSGAFKINNRGDIVGNFSDGGFQHGFLLSKGVLTILDFPGASDTNAWGINNVGTVVGYWDILDADGNPLITHGFIWNKGNFKEVDLPGVDNTFIVGVNDRGDLVGLWGQDPTGNNTGSAFFWPEGRGSFTSFDAPFPDVVLTQANDINDVGAIVGVYVDVSGHGFLRVGTAMIGFDYPGATSTSPWSINPMFQIVGVWRDSSGTRHGFLAQPGE
jgi:uncharacterized membrane protein